MAEFNNIITIHLKRFKSVKEFEVLLADNNITTIVPEKIFEMIEMGWKKVFLDKTSGYVIGYEHKDSKIILDDYFKTFLHNAPSITFSKSELTVDGVLEKIHTHGIESINKREKDFLDSKYSG